MVELVLLIIILEILIRLITYFKRRKIFFLYENVLFNEKRAAYKSHPNLNYIKSFNVKNPKSPVVEYRVIHWHDANKTVMVIKYEGEKTKNYNL